MDLSSLKPAKGSVKSKTRVGRGEGSKKVVLQGVVLKGKNLVVDIVVK